MQGNLDEIDIRSILQLIEVGQRTGVLFVVPGAPKHHWGAKQAALGHNVNVCWFVFFLNGQIVYASNNGGQSRLRLDDYLRHYRVKVRLDETQLEKDALQSLPEYTYLWALLEQNIINTTQARSIIQGLIDETIFDLLNLQQGNFLFEVTSPLAPVLTTWDTVALTSKVFTPISNHPTNCQCSPLSFGYSPAYQRQLQTNSNSGLMEKLRSANLRATSIAIY
jgi:twitching motility two-component system response regulator PilG